MRMLPVLLAIAPTVLFAAEPPMNGGAGGQMGGPPGPPPKVFFDACKNKKDGDSLTMQNAQGQRMTGSCRMVWMPSQPMGGGGPQQGGQLPGANNNMPSFNRQDK